MVAAVSGCCLAAVDGEGQCCWECSSVTAHSSPGLKVREAHHGKGDVTVVLLPLLGGAAAKAPPYIAGARCKPEERV